jgi:hypothetical protein
MTPQPKDPTDDATTEEVEDLEASDTEAEEVSGGLTHAWPKKVEFGAMKAGDSG